MKIKLFAHRCGARTGPENTIEAAQTAVDLGVDGLECDVQLTADNEPVIFHDDDLQRLAGDPAQVQKVTYKELAAKRIFGKNRIPHLKDVLDFIKSHPGLKCFFDFHRPSFKLAEVAANLVVKEGLQSRCFLLGFFSESKDFLLWARSVEPLIRVSLMPEYPWRILEKAQQAGAENICLGWDWQWKNRYLFKSGAWLVGLKTEIVRLKASGIEVSGGIANTPEDISWFLAQGVQGIWTDDIRTAKEVLG